MPVLYFTVTTDINYDQRMIRICSSLATAGYQVHLIGRKNASSLPIVPQNFNQKRISCLFKTGPLFYAEFNIRLFIFLLFKKMDGICAIDLDTILPVLYISKLKNCKRIYDAHELFCEMKEIADRPRVYKVWKWIERNTVPQFNFAYTVNKPIAEAFEKMYGNAFAVIRNMAKYSDSPITPLKEKFIYYQGALNQGRSFETLIPAMQWVNVPLLICGEGNFSEQARQLVKKFRLENKVQFKGLVRPDELKKIASEAYIGITLFEKEASSNYYSLANRFFDYLQAGTPQLVVDYPVYRELNNLGPIGVLIEDLSSQSIARHLNELLADEKKWMVLHENCLKLRTTLNWQEEEKILLAFYKEIFG